MLYFITQFICPTWRRGIDINNPGIFISVQVTSLNEPPLNSSARSNPTFHFPEPLDFYIFKKYIWLIYQISPEV